MSDPTPTPRPQQAEQPDQLQAMPRTQPVQPPPQTHPPTRMTQPLQPTPQDAPLHSTPPQPGGQPGGQPAGPRAPSVSTAQASLPEREVRYLSRATGPNWGLVLLGLAFVVVAAGVMANQVSGLRVGQLADTGPGVLVGVGLLCALIGIVGMVARRRQ